jgi:hypothetical protein
MTRRIRRRRAPFSIRSLLTFRLMAPAETVGEVLHSIRQHETVNAICLVPVRGLVRAARGPGFRPTSNNPRRSHFRHMSAFSRRVSRPSLMRASPSIIERAQGRPGAGRTHGPPANKKQAASPQVQPNIRPSLRDGFNGVLRALLGDRAFLPPSPRESSSTKLSASVGVPEPHDFSVPDLRRSSDAKAASIASHSQRS